jgi:hypothetical protein
VVGQIVVIGIKQETGKDGVLLCPDWGG